MCALLGTDYQIALAILAKPQQTCVHQNHALATEKTRSYQEENYAETARRPARRQVQRRR